MPPETKYVTSVGGVNIAYQVVGDGPFDLVFVPGFISHLDLQWAEPRVARFLEKLASFSRLILFDKRGTGLSDPVAGPPALDDRMEDVHAVMDAAGSERAALFGLSEGGPMSVLFAATYPERTRALVLCGTYATMSLDPAKNPGGQQWVDAIARVQETVEHWGTGDTLSVFAPSANTERDRIGRGVFERSAASPQMARMLVDANLTATDVTDLLPSIRVPTLVLHRAEEFIPVACAEYLAERIPGAKLVVLPGSDHIPFYGDGDGYAEEIEEFLTGARRAPASNRVLATVLFTDIVGSTARSASVGDAEWAATIARHNDIVRAELARHGGREVKTMGDGFLATFDRPGQGIRCAHAIAESVRSLRIQVRAGLHTGECELVGSDISGMAVNICARIGALAGADEVLVSSTVKDLVAGSGISFTDRGQHQLKGVPDQWHLYQVASVAPPLSNQVIDDLRELRVADRAFGSAARRAPRLMGRVLGGGHGRSRRTPGT
jgi:pimeloyl-ACP methyl ester carboxylesterase/class 3 adenylate cyclase